MKEQAQIETQQIIGGMNYNAYRTLIDKLIAASKTTGNNHSEQLLEYTHLNIKRMSKWDKIGKITPSLEKIMNKVNRKQKWILISEAWCGDAAQNLPFIAKAAAINENIDLQIILRDENLDIMNQYLTNGAMAIPKLVIKDAETNKDLAVWGPRPRPVQQMLIDMKANGEFDYNQFAILAHTWYAKDKGITLQNELEKLIEELL
jgi:hypothetical protein